MKPFNPDGIEPNPNRKGFLDYLRDLRQDPFPFPPGSKIVVEGLEDVLLAAGGNLSEVESRIPNILTSRANELNSVMGTNVQIVFRENSRSPTISGWRLVRSVI